MTANTKFDMDVTGTYISKYIFINHYVIPEQWDKYSSGSNLVAINDEGRFKDVHKYDGRADVCTSVGHEVLR